jgi:hypothetical protein
MKSHSNSRTSPSPAARRTERRSAFPSAAIPPNASQLRRHGSLTPSAEEALTPVHHSQIPNHQSTSPHFLIATREKLEICLSSSQQTRKVFLIATFSGLLAYPRLLARAIPRAQRHILKAAPLSRPLPSNGKAGNDRAHGAITSVCACTEPLRN